MQEVPHLPSRGSLCSRQASPTPTQNNQALGPTNLASAKWKGCLETRQPGTAGQRRASAHAHRLSCFQMST